MPNGATVQDDAHGTQEDAQELLGQRGNHCFCTEHCHAWGTEGLEQAHGIWAASPQLSITLQPQPPRLQAELPAVLTASSKKIHTW